MSLLSNSEGPERPVERQISILHIISTVDRLNGGPINAIIQLAASYRGINVTIASLDDPDADCVQSCPVKTVALGEAAERRSSALWRRPLNHYGYTPRMVPWLKDNIGRFDVAIVDGLWNYSTMAASRVLVGGSVPYVVFTHGMLDPWFKRTYPVKSMAKQAFWLFNEGPLLNSADAVLFTTTDECALARGAFWPYRVREKVVSYGCSDISGSAQDQITAFRAHLPALGQRRFLLFLSRLHYKKGCDLLIEAFAKVAATDPDLRLVMAGPDQTGWMANLKNLAARLCVGDRIHWPGMLTGDVKWGAYRCCEAFVLPSHQENFGIVVAEALAAGKPVLISDKVQIWREVAEGGAGLVEPDTVDGAERLLTRFLALAPAERDRLQQAARTTFLGKFEISKATRAIENVLRAVAASRVGAGNRPA